MSDYELFEQRQFFSVGSDWGDEWYKGDPEVYMPAKRPPIAKELVNVWDHNHAEPVDNFVQNTGAGGESNRIRPTHEVSNNQYAAMYQKMLMSEKNPFKLAEKMQRVPDDVVRKTASIIEKLDKEQGLLGNHYVTVKPFPDCRTAQKFFDKSCKTAKYIKKESKCEGCSFRSGNHCGMMGRDLVTQVPYSREDANEALKNAYNKGAIDREDFNKIAKIRDPKERLQNVYLASAYNKYSPKNDAEGKRVVTPLEDRGVGASDHRVKAADKREALPNLIAKLIQNGVSWEKILSKTASSTGTAQIKSVLPIALKKISEDYVTPINAVKFANCDDFLINNVSLLKKDASCGGCVFNQGHKCSKLKAAFVKEAGNDYVETVEKQIKKAFTVSKDISGELAKYINAGVSNSILKTAFLNNSSLAEYNKQLEVALKTASKLSPFKFSGCEGDFYKHVAKVYRDHNCSTCYHNERTHCAKVKKAFVNPAPEQFEHETALPMVDRNTQIQKEAAIQNKLENWAIKQLERKVSSKTFIQAVTDKAPSHIASKVISNSISKAASLNTAAWNNCTVDELTKKAQKVVRVKKCDGCRANHGSKCARFNKAFINPKAEVSFSENMPVENIMEYFDRPDGSSRYPTMRDI